MKKFFATIITLLYTGVLFSQGIEGGTELAGFFLGQYRKAIHHELGAPIEKRVTEDHWIYEFHKLRPDTSVYALFKYPSWDTTRLYSIQINGEEFTEMHPFFGLKLGAGKEEVDRIFGEIDHTRKVDDPPLTIQYYKNKNYSFEIDPAGTVVGIQIFGNVQATPPKAEKPSLAPFKKAVVSKNIDSLLHYLSPDVEFYKKGKVVTYSGAARKEFKKENSELVDWLIGQENSLWAVFAKEFAEGGLDTRVNQHTNETFYVQKFFDSNIISEIAFIPHAGRWKVYEVRFR